MSQNDDNKVVKLHTPKQPPQEAATSSLGDPIAPKSLLNMTEVEQNMFLEQLRERRLRAAQMLKQAKEAQRHATDVASTLKLERKAEQVQRQYDRAIKSLDKLEELIYDLRALTLQHTDVDIAK